MIAACRPMPGQALALGGLLLACAAGCVGRSPAAPPVRAPVAAHARPRPAPALEAVLQALAQRVAPHGVSVGEPVAVGFLASGARQSFPVDLAAGTCVTLVSLATQGVVDMDAALYTPDGRLLAADSQPDSHPSLQICVGEATRRYYVVLQSFEGSGSVVVVALSGPRSTFSHVARVLGGRPARALPSDTLTPVEDTLQAFSSGLGRRGYEPRGEPVNLALASQQRVRFPVPVRAGQCYAVAAFAHTGLRDIHLRVFDDQGTAVAGDAGPLAAARVHFCASTEAEFGAEAYARDGSGTATLLVLEGPSHRVLGQTGRWIGKSEAGQLSERHAVGEVLGKLQAEAEGDGYSRVVQRVEGYLQPREAVAHEVLLRDRQCYSVAVAAADGVSGVSLGLVGPVAAGATALPAPSPQAARARVCPTATGIVQLRVAAAAGAGDYQLLVLQR